ILTGGILGIVMMRMVIGKLLAIVDRYPPLVDGAFGIIAWVGIKLFLEYLHGANDVGFEILKWFSLGLLVLIFVASLMLAHGRRPQRGSRAEQDARKLLIDDDLTHVP